MQSCCTQRSRLPVVDERGQVQGMVNVLDTLLDPEAKLEDLLKPVPRFPADMRVLDALEQLRRDREPMAIVVPPDGGGTPIGLVALKDLVEPMTGDLAAW